MKTTKIALVGIGKIARDQHVPAITEIKKFELVASVDPYQNLETINNFASIDEMLAAKPDVTAVAICTPTQFRYQVAREALLKGLHVFLEKPPGVTLSEVHELIDLAKAKNLTLFAAWHSRESAAVEPAQEWLINRNIKKVTVNWKENVRQWHPNQPWIWEAGGFGVFDAGINSLSIITKILPGRLILQKSDLMIPSNCNAPIAATLQFKTTHNVEVDVAFDFLEVENQHWEIDIETDEGRLSISKAGAVIELPKIGKVESPDEEYRRLYSRFLQLIEQQQTDVDIEPLSLVADAFMCGRRVEVEPFVE